jgi:hypothetical protein
MAPRRATPDGSPVCRVSELPPADAGRSAVFLLTCLKTYTLQVVQGRLFGMRQSKANQWSHVLWPALLAALRTLGDAPIRSLVALAQRLGVSEADAATVVTPLAEVPAASLLPMTERRIVRPQDPADGCGLSMSTAVSSAVASSKTGSAYERRAFAIW